MQMEQPDLGLGVSLPAGNLPDDLDAGSMFSILIAALRNSSAMVFDGTGRIVWCCPRAAASLGCADPTEPIGQPLSRFAPDLWAAERVTAVAQAIREQRVVTLAGIVDGVRVVTRCIPLARNGHGGDRVLAVIEPVTAEEIGQLERPDAGHTVTWSRVHDLGPLDVLTAREIEVLALLGRGIRTKEIAETLHRSVSTIDGHRERIGQKLGLKDRAELIAVARRAVLRVEDAEGARIRLRPQPDSD
tara:strand:+ start:8181 stop:8915 length:735 start_codon:yes stop_codon:yes gene_type:complete